MLNCIECQNTFSFSLSLSTHPTLFPKCNHNFARIDYFSQRDCILFCLSCGIQFVGLFIYLFLPLQQRVQCLLQHPVWSSQLTVQVACACLWKYLPHIAGVPKSRESISFKHNISMMMKVKPSDLLQSRDKRISFKRGGLFAPVNYSLYGMKCI